MNARANSPAALDVVAVGAHPDDVEISCGGPLAGLVAQGYRVGIIDLGELKGFSLRCTSGEIQLTASAGTPLPFFAAAADGIKLEAGHALALSFGAAGLDVTTNSLFEITETSGASSATYELVFHGAN